MVRKTIKKLRHAVVQYYCRHKTINKWPVKLREKSALLAYKRHIGRTMDIRNPVTFTEKITWYKLYYKKPGIEKIVDKYHFKSYIEEKLGPGYTLPMFGAWRTVKAFRRDWGSMPEEFCLKANIMSGGEGIRIIHKKSEEDLDDICRFVTNCLNPKNTLLNSYCNAYYKTKPMIIAEQYMTQLDNQLYDYKIFCFDGVPNYAYVATDHFPGQLSRISFYDLEWNRLDVQYGNHPNCKVEKPAHFIEMLDIAKKLSSDFPFVRVDFFDTEEKLYLAELTFYPGGGLTAYKPEEFNRHLGELFRLPLA